MTNERVRSARARVMPTASPFRLTTGPPIWFGLGRMSVWMAWVNESRTWLMAPPMRSIDWRRSPDNCGILGRFFNNTLIVRAEPLDSTNSGTVVPGEIPARALFNSSKPEIDRSAIFRMTFPRWSPASSAPESSVTLAIFTPWPRYSGSPMTPRYARSVSRKFRSRTLTTP